MPYKVEGGKVITFVSQDPYAVTVYKLGDKYHGARSNEFGYANYEMIPTPKFVTNAVAAQPVLRRAWPDPRTEGADYLKWLKELLNRKTARLRAPPAS